MWEKGIPGRGNSVKSSGNCREHGLTKVKVHAR